MQTLGQTLKNKRESADLSVDDIVYLARIPRSVVQALESDDIEHFDCLLYAQSFLKQYGAYIGLDVDPWLETLITKKAMPEPAEPEAKIDIEELKEEMKKYFFRIKRRCEDSKPTMIIVSVLIIMMIAYRINENFEASHPASPPKNVVPAQAERDVEREPQPPFENENLLSTEPEPPKRAIIVELPPPP